MSLLRITFDGVVAIGPAEPTNGSHEQPGPLFAVMPRVDRQLSRWSKLYSDKPSYIPFHTPVMFTDLQPLPKMPPGTVGNGGQAIPDKLEDAFLHLRRPDEIFPYRYRLDQPKEGEFYIWYPMRERLEFRFDDEVDDGWLTYGMRPYGEPTLCDLQAHKRRDIGAVSDMREIWPERCHLRREVLSRRPPSEVVGQVFIPKGYVTSGYYGRQESEGEYASFEPKRTPDVVKKCLVPQIEVSVEVEEFVHILSYSLDTGEKLDSISFQLTAPANILTPPANILIGNADPGDIRKVLKRLVYPDAKEPIEKRSDFDFELYYTLLEGEDDGGGLPVPLSEYGKFGNPHCYTAKVAGSP
jgi:hypothetical protein